MYIGKGGAAPDARGTDCSSVPIFSLRSRLNRIAIEDSLADPGTGVGDDGSSPLQRILRFSSSLRAPAAHARGQTGPSTPARAGGWRRERIAAAGREWAGEPACSDRLAGRATRRLRMRAGRPCVALRRRRRLDCWYQSRAMAAIVRQRALRPGRGRQTPALSLRAAHRSATDMVAAGRRCLHFGRSRRLIHSSDTGEPRFRA